MVKDFPWNIISWNALFFEKSLKQLSILDIENNGFILNTCHDTAKRAETRVGFPVIFSRLRWLIEPKFSQVSYFIYKLWYTKCGPLENTVQKTFESFIRGVFIQQSRNKFELRRRKFQICSSDHGNTGLLIRSFCSIRESWHQVRTPKEHKSAGLIFH